MPDARLTGKGRSGLPDAILLPRPRERPRTKRSHVELHILDMLLTWEADQVVDLSPCDLPAPHEDLPCCWVVIEGRSSLGPSPGYVIRTSRPRLRMEPPPVSSSIPTFRSPLLILCRPRWSHQSVAEAPKGRSVSMQDNAIGSESSLRNSCEERMNETRSQGYTFIAKSRCSRTVGSEGESNSTTKMILINEGTGRRSIKGVVSIKRTCRLPTRRIPQK